MFATMFAGEFVRSGAKNYLELDYNVPAIGDFVVTIQRKEGKTPVNASQSLRPLWISVTESVTV